MIANLYFMKINLALLQAVLKRLSPITNSQAHTSYAGTYEYDSSPTELSQKIVWLAAGRKFRLWCPRVHQSLYLLFDSAAFIFLTDSFSSAIRIAKSSESWIATGNWGCGVFAGDLELKLMIQMIAASLSGRPVHYFTFSNPSKYLTAK